jgi:outer membrane biosynthesis protein TonB
MATAAPSPNDLTRQQLDELDALLQRMLSLPLNPPESFAPSAPTPAYAPPMPVPASMPAPVAREVVAPTPAPGPRLLATPVMEPPRSAPESSPIPVPWKTAAPPAPAPTPAPVSTPRPAPAPMPVQPAPKVEKTARPAPIPTPVPTPAPVKPAPLAIPTPAPVEPIAAAPRSDPAPFLLAPLVGFNAALNWTLGLFGFPGRVLRSGFVKNLFGLAGLGLLAYTGLKVAQIHSLVSLPMQLPWPR